MYLIIIDLHSTTVRSANLHCKVIELVEVLTVQRSGQTLE
ncbi:MAG: hypothetical protein ACI8XB_001299 [Patiriisocius sp.]|jgi:hypothetical protein